MLHNQRGFTLTELLLSVAIIGIISGLSMPLYSSFATRNNLALTAETTVNMLRRASLYARSGHQDSQWGVNFQPGSFVLFKGASYSARDPAFDEPFSVAGNISSDYDGDIVFNKLSGTTLQPRSIKLSGPEGSVTMEVNAKGAVSY